MEKNTSAEGSGMFSGMTMVARRSSPLDMNEVVSPEVEKSGQSSLLKLLRGGPLIDAVVEAVSKSVWILSTSDKEEQHSEPLKKMRL